MEGHSRVLQEGAGPPHLVHVGLVTVPLPGPAPFCFGKNYRPSAPGLHKPNGPFWLYLSSCGERETGLVREASDGPPS
jgi:hypothetical protein